MYCNNCGTENEKETKFCVKCGKELGKKGEGLGTASMILGIISIVLSFIITVVTLPLSITGLILGIVNKAKGGKKISGIVLNAISIFLSIVLIFVYLFIGIGIFSAVISDPEVRKELENLERDIDRYSSTNYVEGEYNCKNFDGNGATGSYIVRFELDDDMNFMWGKYGDTYNNYVKGSYTYKDLDKKNAAGNYSYYNIKLDGDVFYKDGVKQTEPYASEYEFGITKDNGKKQGIIMNTKTYNMYYCYED
ncbi:MAG: zinc-ribbon domain-containing protein [Bacilli bacterium]|nr:zinc-ribbon domain-containing protein [Bacilli bacterium]